MTVSDSCCVGSITKTYQADGGDIQNNNLCIATCVKLNELTSQYDTMLGYRICNSWMLLIFDIYF